MSNKEASRQMFLHFVAFISDERSVLREIGRVSYNLHSQFFSFPLRFLEALS